MLDKGGAFTMIDATDMHIWWGAYVGMPEQTLIHGPLAEVSDDILATRARLRAEHGWIMDIYLLRRGGDV
jgi:precorrin-6A synthase